MEHLADTIVFKTDFLEICNKCHLQQSSVEGSDSIGYYIVLLYYKTEKIILFCIKQLSLNHAKSC